MVLRECAICQTSIYPAEQTHPCPKCGLVFHAECWQENFGCASYGCDQVNALAPKVEVPPAVTLPPPSDKPIEALPWDFLLLGAAALAMLLSALSWGIASWVVGGAIGVRLFLRLAKGRPVRLPVLIVAAALCLIGIVCGPLVSYFWFTQVDYTAVAG